MVRIALVLGACALLAAALWLREPPAPSSPRPPAPGATAGSPSQAERGRPVAAPPPRADADRAAPAAPPAPEARTEGPEPEAGRVPLEKLLTLTDPLAPPDPLAQGRIPADADALKEEGRLRFLHRRESSELGSERIAEDELGVLLTLDEARTLGLRGGVRLEREHSARDPEEREAGPAIGIEKRF